MSYSGFEVCGVGYVLLCGVVCGGGWVVVGGVYFVVWVCEDYGLEVELWEMEVYKCYVGDFCLCLFDLKVYFWSFGLNFVFSVVFVLKCYLDVFEGRFCVLYVGICECIVIFE